MASVHCSFLRDALLWARIMRSAYASSTWILHDVSGGVCGVGAFESLVFIGIPCWLVMSAECNYLYLFSLRFWAGVAIF